MCIDSASARLIILFQLNNTRYCVLSVLPLIGDLEVLSPRPCVIIVVASLLELYSGFIIATDVLMPIRMERRRGINCFSLDKVYLTR